MDQTGEFEPKSYNSSFRFTYSEVKIRFDDFVVEEHTYYVGYKLENLCVELMWKLRTKSNFKNFSQICGHRRTRRSFPRMFPALICGNFLFLHEKLREKICKNSES